MSSYLYYNVLKMYKGTLKKTYKGNTHLLMVPISPKKYLYLAVIGQLVDQQGSYACQLIISIPSRLVDSIVSGEEEHFGNRYVVVEKLKCEPRVAGESHYNVSLEDPEKAKNIKSDLTIEYHPEFNIGSKRVYIVTGELEFETEEISSKGEMGMTAAKQSALIGKKDRFEEPETNIKEGDSMKNTDKLKVALMGSIRESNLPKKGKLLLLGLVFENEDLEQTLDILESFAVIDEEEHEKIKTRTMEALDPNRLDRWKTRFNPEYFPTFKKIGKNIGRAVKNAPEYVPRIASRLAKLNVGEEEE